LGAKDRFDPHTTVEGKSTAQAVARLCAEKGLDMPVLQMIAALVAGEITPDLAASQLMSRPLTKE
jgi:glycerol-3-phosphate dehydrogenase (NAD(P)+)